eukprot:TRINITY_DN28520_c0_g1_i1.p1 TRINITY_DN28520_c0_g1~~TRINITY_DN28520_c0_g1_i1.p1  ORF type:complete len:346 (-),score=26.11 TRINITY_DN28520_c0_g1_i1:114-1151(-)
MWSPTAYIPQVQTLVTPPPGRGSSGPSRLVFTSEATPSPKSVPASVPGRILTSTSSFAPSPLWVASQQRSPNQPYQRTDVAPATKTRTSILWGFRVRVDKNFPYIFSLLWCLGFCFPILSTLHLSNDPSVIYFTGSWCRFAYVLPIFLISSHAVHVLNHGVPVKKCVLICTLVPGVVIYALNDAVRLMSLNQGSAMRSLDCHTSAEKRDLQRSWDVASVLYDNCLRDTVAAATKPNMTLDVARTLYRIDDCDEYPSVYIHNKVDWDYLRGLEEEHACGGWCSVDRPLWTFHDTRDSCANAVSHVFNRKIDRLTIQNIVYSFCLIVAVVVGYVLIGPFMHSQGYEW